MVITRGGIMIRIALDEVSEQSRNTQGVRIINLNKGDQVGGIAKISQDIAIEADEANGGDGDAGAEDTTAEADDHQEEPSGE